MCINRDIYGCIALNHLIHFVHCDEVKICFSDGVGVVKKVEELNNLLFWEQQFPLEDLCSIGGGHFRTFDEIVESDNIEVLQFDNINRDGVEYLQDNWQVDLVVSIRYGVIFKEEFIALPKIGIVNLHSGILPKYRGIMSTFWAMLNGEKEIGTTLHKITDRTVDEGQTLVINKVKVKNDKSLVYNICSLYEGGCESIKSVINAIRTDGEIKPIMDANAGDGVSNYYSYPSALDFEKFKERFKVLDKEEFFSDVVRDFFQ
ncbi:MAG: hypothetical protein ISQ34_03525 [Rickettsiales bacterium]|nr:hypothetical protein [Rickettsiales bacterium]